MPWHLKTASCTAQAGLQPVRVTNGAVGHWSVLRDVLEEIQTNFIGYTPRFRVHSIQQIHFHCVNPAAVYRFFDE